MRARRLGDYVMTEAKQARLKELAQIEKDRDLATLNAQSAILKLERPAELLAQLAEPSAEPLAEPLAEPPAEHPPASEPIPIPRARRTRARAIA